MLELKPTPITTKPRRCVLLVTVTSNERRAVFQVLKERRIEVVEEFERDFPHDVFDWPPGHAEPLRVWLIRVETQRAPATAAAIARYQQQHRFEAVVMVGMAMGLPGRVTPGDVIVPSEVISLSHVRETKAGPSYIPHLYKPDGVAVGRLRSVLDRLDPPFPFGVHSKQHACGDRKIEDPACDFTRRIEQISPEMYSYEMEAEGFFAALGGQSVEALLIKGIADFGDAPGGRATGTAAKVPTQVQATRNALDVAFAYLKHLSVHPV